MSHTTIVHIFPGNKIERADEFDNSYGSAPVIWDLLCFKYLKQSWFSGGLDNLWPLWKNTNIPEHHRAVLMMTFDKAYVSKKDYPRAASDIRKFFSDFEYSSDYVNHWPKIASLFESNPDAPGVGIWHTSVSENPYCGKWNDEREEYDTDWQGLYDIYARIDALKG